MGYSDMNSRLLIPIFIFDKPHATGHKSKSNMKSLLEADYAYYLKMGGGIFCNDGNIIPFSVGKKWVHYKIGDLPIEVMPDHETHRKVLVSEVEHNQYFHLLKRPEFVFRI
jgi:hypothetical protein